MSAKVLRFDLSDGRHFEVTLEWLQAQLMPQGLHVITACASGVLDAMAAAPKAELIAEQLRDGGRDWRSAVAAAELTRRLEAYAEASYARRAASHNSGACEPEPKPTRHKPR